MVFFTQIWSLVWSLLIKGSIGYPGPDGGFSDVMYVVSSIFRRAMSAPVNVSMFSTGSVQIRPEHLGPTRLPALAWLLTSQLWTKPRPINVYVIRHPKGTLVFDTGQDRMSVIDPKYFPKGLIGWLYKRLARFSISEANSFENGLRRLGVALDSVDFVILSHLHQDHIGGLRSFAGKRAKIIVDSAELKAANRVGAVFDGYLKQHIFLKDVSFTFPDLGLLPQGAIPGFTFGWDVFNDGLVVLLPLPGHTQGSLGLLINYGHSKPVLLVGDLTYDVGLLKSKIVPGVGVKKVMRRSSSSVMELITSSPALLVAASHDPNVQLHLSDGE